MPNYRIKKDKFTGDISILDGFVPICTVSASSFVAIANAIVKYVVGKGYIISAPETEEKAKGFGKYHFIKGFVLAVIHDIKKKYAAKSDT